MIFSREYVSYLARQTVEDIDANVIRTQKVDVLNERVNQALLEELSLEDRINEEVRVILEAYQDDMRRTGASYPEMFKKVKMELAKKLQGGVVRVSRDKLNKMAHTVADTFAEVAECDFLERPKYDSSGSAQGPRKDPDRRIEARPGCSPEDCFSAQNHPRR